MGLDEERSNRMFNLFIIGFILAFVVGCGLGAFIMAAILNLVTT